MKTIIEARQPMHSPPHPGEVLVTMYMDELGLTITQVADALGVSRKHVSAIVNGRAPITADMAFRLAAALDSTPQIWLNMQMQHDIWELSQKPRPKVKRLAA